MDQQPVQNNASVEPPPLATPVLQNQQAAAPTIATPVVPPVQPQKDSTPTIVTVLLLLLFTPIGVIVMWIWPKWKTWVKIVITIIPLLMFFLAIMAAALLVAINPSAQFAKARNMKRVTDVKSIESGVKQLILTEGALPPETQAVFATPEPVAFASATGPEMVALCEYLTGNKGNGGPYILSLPIDPKLQDPESKEQNCQDFDTGYDIAVIGTEVTATAPLTEDLSRK